MTEDEAQTKWCPFARVVILSASGPPIGPANRAVGRDGKEGADGPKCIASACMAWRPIIRTEMRHRDGHVVRPGEVYLRGNATEHRVSDGGYCGLAGDPR